MNIISVDNITKYFSEKPLFKDTSFFLQEGEKVGVIGINGMGKSTLLKMLVGKEEPDEGKITFANNLVIKYLPQHPTFNEEDTIIQSVINNCVFSDDTSDNTRMELESTVKNMLMKLGIQDFSQKTCTLSGGQKKKVALVSTLVSQADVLILDEPTNHLDNKMADWLEDYLKKYRKSLIMVTHDRYFLDSVVDRIVEIDKGKIYSYQTNYSGFLKHKAEREEMELASERKRKSILRTELEWIQRGARARSTKQKARIERYESLKDMKAPTTTARVELSSVSTRLGRTTVELKDICMQYDNKVLINKFSYIFLKDDRVGFIGENGCGKTTLMKIIAGRIKPNSGDVTVGQTVKIGYYTQEIQNEKSEGIAYMNPSSRVIDYIRDTAEYVVTKDGSISASQMLEKFLFDSSKQYNVIEKLSGGEKRRLNLLRVLMEAPNVLILDEPTNDLDIATLTILEDYLDNFDGIVIVVSHDRYFLDRTMKRIFAFEDGTINQYEGGYTDYALRKEIEQMETAQLDEKNDSVKPSEKKENSSWQKTKKLKFSYNEQKEYETIESDVALLEDKIKNCESDIIKFASDFIKLNEIMAQKEKLEAELEEKMDRWMYLEELAEKISNQ